MRGKTRQFVAVAILNPDHNQEVDVMEGDATEGLPSYLISVPLSELDELLDEQEEYHCLHDVDDEEYAEAYVQYFLSVCKRNKIRYQRLPDNFIGVYTPQ